MKEVFYIISWDNPPIIVEDEPYEKSEVGLENPYLIFRGVPLN